MPRGKPAKGQKAVKLKGSMDPGYKDAYEVAETHRMPDDVAMAPEILEALKTVDVDVMGTEEVSLKGHLEDPDVYDDTYEDEIGNGGTLPFRYRGRPSLAYTTCSEPVKDRNRGCPAWYRCPLRDMGSGNFAYQMTKTGQIRMTNCYDFVMTGMIRDRNIVLLPGIDYAVSMTVRWAPFPTGHPLAGQYPSGKPGDEKTELVHTPVKNPIPALFDADLIRQYQILRVRGEVG